MTHAKSVRILSVLFLMERNLSREKILIIAEKYLLGPLFLQDSFSGRLARAIYYIFTKIYFTSNVKPSYLSKSQLFAPKKF